MVAGIVHLTPTPEPAMRLPTLTPWFDAADRPRRAGVYRRRWPAGPYSCWDGRQWRADAATPDAAAARTGPSRHAQAPWQGLVTPPDAPCLTCKGHTVRDHGVDEETGADLITECPDC